MEFSSLFSQELCFAKAEGASKKRIIEVLAQNIAETLEEFDANSLFMNLINREKLGSTGIGNGLAIPHCRCDDTSKSIFACMTLSSPVDFDTFDQQPVDVIFALIVPQGEEGSHLKHLAQLAEAGQDTGFLNTLRDAPTSEKLYSALMQR